SLAGSCAAGNQVSAHGMTVILRGAKNLRLLWAGEQQNNGQRCFAPLNMTQLGVGGNAPQPAYSSSGPLGVSNAASVIMREAGGSGVWESSTRCTFGPSVASSGWVAAMFTGVPIRTSA